MMLYGLTREDYMVFVSRTSVILLLCLLLSFIGCGHGGAGQTLDLAKDFVGLDLDYGKYTDFISHDEPIPFDEISMGVDEISAKEVSKDSSYEEISSEDDETLIETSEQVMNKDGGEELLGKTECEVDKDCPQSINSCLEYICIGNKCKEVFAEQGKPCGNKSMACKLQVCDGNGTCITTNMLDGTQCDDENPCTLNDKCIMGLCIGEAQECCSNQDCGEGEICYKNKCCVPSCLGKCFPSPDGCGGLCKQECQPGYVCNQGECIEIGSKCGDGICDKDENCAICAKDCGQCCPNGKCDQGETCNTCPADCGYCTLPEPIWPDMEVKPCKSCVQAKGKSFVKDFQPFFIKGINYFPSYYPPLAFEHHWLDPDQYIPTEIEDDLTFLEKQGINTLVIQGSTWWSSDSCIILKDFLQRANNHKMMVLLFLEGCNPLSPNPDKCEKIITNCELAKHPAVLGYDIHWEPHLIPIWDYPNPLWVIDQELYNQYLQDRFGGDIGLAKAYIGGDTSIPIKESQLCSNSSNINVALFRSYIDYAISLLYGKRIRQIRVVDPYHLIGMRNGFGGNGSSWACKYLPLDLRAGIRHISFVGPEGYALVPYTDKKAIFNRGGFTIAYGDVGKPIVWMEFGYETLGKGDIGLSEQKMYYDYIYEMSTVKGANGVISWWYVGKRPQNSKDTEKSDFGIIFDHGSEPTGMDTQRQKTRDAWYSLCTANDVDIKIAVLKDEKTDQTFGCPQGYMERGSFMPDFGQFGETGVGFDGKKISIGWMGICTTTQIGLYVSYDDISGKSYSCPNGFTQVASFKPETSGKPNEYTGFGVDGKGISSGWLGLCVPSALVGKVGLYITRNELSGLDRTCPLGLEWRGAFKPNTLPIFKPEALALADQTNGFIPVERKYVDFVTVDRDLAAGDFVMYDEGINQYAKKGGGLIGAITPCTGTTSNNPGQYCIGNKPLSQTCPPKCLNAEFDAIYIYDPKSNSWKEFDIKVGKNEWIVTVPSNMPLSVAIQVGNTGEATWVHGDGKGHVFLGCNEKRGDIWCRIPLKEDVPFLGTARLGPFQVIEKVTIAQKIVLQMVSENIAWFGPSVTILVKPE